MTATHMHVMEPGIDLGKLPVMSNILVNFDFALEIIWTCELSSVPFIYPNPDVCTFHKDGLVFRTCL